MALLQGEEEREKVFCPKVNRGRRSKEESSYLPEIALEVTMIQ
ncbi:uncharacterized protein DNG_01631 [Cephalotrichum gorgonifer]|uniref:Uncharacterized protein n=1 Tax=Cephalotrichum gorgonifer TaxID=2041049 RepID=A0AAE8SRU7_9PEZI|nr:uncharacterized protein DNG_01631 [Cephalotrichum gorgonifer]